MKDPFAYISDDMRDKSEFSSWAKKGCTLLDEGMRIMSMSMSIRMRKGRETNELGDISLYKKVKETSLWTRVETLFFTKT